MERFAIEPRIYFGPDPMEALEALAGRRAMVVTDAFLASSGLLERVRCRLTGPVEVFDRVEPDPSLRLVAEGVAALRTFQPEVVIAFGGGSPMDCAKAMCWLSQERPPLWCVPTTAGTGSEVTSFAVLTDTDRGVKLPLVDDALLPQAAILDPALLAGVPPAVTADTGMDVLTHAAEAAVARGRSPFSDALAEAAFALAYRSLPAAWAGDLGAKGDMLHASCMAGMAFNAAGLGACHALAHALGGRFHLPHGRLNALLLPQVIRFHAQDRGAGAAYRRLAERCGLGGGARGLAAALARLRDRLGIAPRLPVPQEELRAALPGLVEAALADACLPSDPAEVRGEDLQALLLSIGGGA